MINFNVNTFEEKVGDKTITLECGKLARQANGSVLVRIGDTVLFSAAVCAKTPRSGIPAFVPLTVDYRERTYAAGKIPGGFFKREGRMRDKETLACRLTDRSLRPLFPKGYNTETQVLSIVMSSDQENDADILGILGASAAITISSIPFDGPISAVRIGRIDSKFIINPTFQERETSEMDLVIAGTLNGITMVEGGGREIPDDILLSAMETAKHEIDKLCNIQLALREKAGKPKFSVEPLAIDEELKKAVEETAKPKISSALAGTPSKEELSRFVEELKTGLTTSLAEKFPGSEPYVKIIVEEVLYHESRALVLDKSIRVDGRKYDEIRPLASTTGILPRAHGSALFTRGQTQALVTCTLGTPQDMQIMDELEGRFKERFLFHYNFPGFATGEVKPERGPGRREIGHGALARKALLPLLPSEEDFPYTIRIVSDILESNGSSSMASVCGGSLALFDAGAPMKAPCAGIAMGLITDGSRHAVLSDILGMEDHLGDMDFKLAGTRKGITAFQMDVKVESVPLSILTEAVAQARQGRNFLLDHMEKTASAPKPDISVYAPRIVKMLIPQEKIGMLIGPGGKNIRRITEETGAEVEVEDDGSVFISGTDSEGVKAAQKMVEMLFAEVEVGKIYNGKVVSILDFGAFIEVMPGKEGLLHISEVAPHRIKRVDDVLKVGQDVEVKVIDKDSSGKFKLSRKILLKNK